MTRALGLGLSALLFAAPLSAVTIDDFSSNQASLTLTFPPAGTSASSSTGGSMLGAERDVQINLTSGVIAGNSLTAVVSSGFFSYSQDATISGNSTVQWDGSDGSPTLNPTGLGGIDLTAGGKVDAIVLNTIFDDLPTNITLTVYTDAGNASAYTFTAPGAIFSATNLVIPFDGFTTTLGAGANFSQVGAITMTIGSAVTAPDFVLDSVFTTARLNAAKSVAIINDVNGNGVADAGDRLRYTVVVTNPSDATATSVDGVTFTDTPGTHTQLVAGSVTTTQGTIDSGNGGTDTSVAANLGNIGDGGSVTLTFDVTIDPDLPYSVTQVSNQGFVSSTMLTDLPTGDPSQPGTADPTLIAVVGVPKADVSITKTDGVTRVVAGGTVSYTIVASNAGPDAAPVTAIADVFPSALSSCQWTCTGSGGGTCTAGGNGSIADNANLPAGASVTYAATCSVSTTATGTLSNTATAASGVEDPDTTNNSATDADAIDVVADLSITKTDGVTTATAGGSVTYTITASNAGPSQATGVSVADAFPPGETCTWTCTGAGGGTCTASGSGNLGDTVGLPPGGSVTYTASCNISAAATGSLTNTALVAPPPGITDPNPANNSATDTDALGTSADLSVTKTDGVASITAGGSTTYTITASNAGPSDAAATVSDAFPADLTCTWTCATSGGAACTAAGNGDIGDSATLPAGSTAVYTASCAVSPDATGTLANTATIASGTTDPVAGNNTATDTDTVLVPSLVSGTKSVSGTFAPGSTVTYTVVLTNNGVTQADNPGDEFTDDVPAPLVVTAASATSGTAAVAGNLVSWNGVLASGQPVTIMITATLPLTATGSIANQGTIHFDADGNGTNETDAPTDDPATGAAGDATVFAVAVAPPVAAVPVPALGFWAMALMALVLGGFGALARRVRPVR